MAPPNTLDVLSDYCDRLTGVVAGRQATNEDQTRDHGMSSSRSGQTQPEDLNPRNRQQQDNYRDEITRQKRHFQQKPMVDFTSNNMNNTQEPRKPRETNIERLVVNHEYEANNVPKVPRKHSIIELSEAYCELKQNNNESHARNKKLAQENAELKTEIQRLEKRAKILQQRITECTADLLDMQPFSTTTDADVVSAFEILSQSVWGWISEAFSTLDELCSTTTPDNGDLSKHLLQASNTGNEWTNQLLNDVPSASEFLVHYIIFSHLAERLLNMNEYTFGILPEAAHILDWVQYGMDLLARQKTESSFRPWSIEALKAIHATPYQKQQDKLALQEFTNTLLNKLVVALPPLRWLEGNLNALQKKVVEPAAELALLARLSLARYEFDMVPKAGLFGNRGSVSAAIFDIFTCKDLESRRTINRSAINDARNAMLSAEDTMIGDWMVVLEPGIVRITGESVVRVRKPVCVIRLSEPLTQRPRTDTQLSNAQRLESDIKHRGL